MDQGITIAIRAMMAVRGLPLLRLAMVGGGVGLRMFGIMAGTV
jgi:hypothetical protein